MIRILFILLILVSSCTSPAEQEQRSPLVGSWELVSWTGTRENGEVVHPYGQDAIGMLIYTGDGSCVLSLSKANRPNLGSDVYKHMSRDTLLTAYSGFFSYHGSYSIDPEQSLVTHHVEACKLPDWRGRDEIRHFHFDGDTLILSGHKVIGMQHELSWIPRK